MSFGGSVAAMITTLKNNRSLTTKRAPFLKSKQQYLKASSALKINCQNATKEELENIRKKLKQQQRIARIKTLVVLLLLSPLIFYGVYQFIILDKAPEASVEFLEYQAKFDKYNYCIMTGDRMTNLREWDNAAFYYLSAHEIFPNKYEVNYLVSLAYAHKCIHDNELCLEADSIVSQLLLKEPYNYRLKEIKNVVTENLDKDTDL